MKIVLTATAKTAFDRLDKPIAKRIVTKLAWLGNHFELVPHRHLTGQLSGFFKLRVGDWRVIYQFDDDDEEIVVVGIGHRREVYDTTPR